MKKKPRSITAGPAAALGTAARGAKLVVEARGAYNATLKRYDFDGELGAAHSACEVGKLILDGKLKISKLQTDKSYGIPYAIERAFFEAPTTRRRSWTTTSAWLLGRGGLAHTAQYGLVVTDDDYVKAISQRARALAERAAEAAKASKVSERWEKRRRDPGRRSRSPTGAAENLKVGQLKSLIYGRTGSGAKASNNKEGAMLEARAPSAI
ncbi:hypothetical protein JL722_10799 [Aureococcus anophagefferens]|nr:hypothetical protein JL722_10799 [Aureococcus anophagefferens]